MTKHFSVSVAGLTGNHPLDLSRQPPTEGLLSAYFTTLPPSRTRGVPPNLVHHHLALLPTIYASMKGCAPISASRLNRFVEREFDRWVSRRVPETQELLEEGARLARTTIGAMAAATREKGVAFSVILLNNDERFPPDLIYGARPQRRRDARSDASRTSQPPVRHASRPSLAPRNRYGNCGVTSYVTCVRTCIETESSRWLRW